MHPRFLTILVFITSLLIVSCDPDEPNMEIDQEDPVFIPPPIENWTEVTNEAPWASRNGHTSLIFQGKMWIIGGVKFENNENIWLNDVWSSEDGSNWTLTSDGMPIQRSGHSSVVYDDKMWILGGGFNNEEFNDVWNSSDGKTWNQVNTSAQWLPRESHATVVFDNKMWVIGGTGDERYSDVWSSIDGINWNEESTDNPWLPRHDHSAVTFDNRIWILGGRTSDRSYFNDVWSSRDGRQWSLVQEEASWEARSAHVTLIFNDEFWLIGGESVIDSTLIRHNIVWTSSDGNFWEARSTASWSPRRGHSAFTWNSNSIWVIAGNDGDIQQDVWYLTP